ncbi:heptaprenyl diphosphate synthase subunit 1 [Melghirimyces profundicolus]|uniref:Heptaprenyl diphosphate synthase subunit 1 n=1 Tax=Melghirimyces profundicolus TaxID=1242148 RepID=A0A2T6BUY5_9BACL|nr:heptaprenyl diphosphate synthase component 1 [Melghirimyces profundicolus]PTX59901.1 heptaprenyl diphosphate synthase subunit 1 [Melghirimyces profundicolus]
MTTISEEVDRIAAEIDRQVRHPFLERYIHRQEVPVPFVRVLYLMMRARGLPEDRIRLYCVTTTLLQMGLSIHETVTTERETEADRLRSRQLTVLAGDYMSSLFYKNLSEAGEIEGVARLSRAICDINEAKMELYGFRNQSEIFPSVFLRLAKRITGGLVTHLSHFFWEDPGRDNPWDPLAENLLLLSGWTGLKVPAAETAGGVPETLLRSLAAETVRQLRKVRPLEIRHELMDWFRGTLTLRLGESLVREG